MNEYVCCICGKRKAGYGNNPWPVVEEFEGDKTNRCCDNCNMYIVVPARMSMPFANKGKDLPK